MSAMRERESDRENSVGETSSENEMSAREGRSGRREKMGRAGFEGYERSSKKIS